VDERYDGRLGVKLKRAPMMRIERKVRRRNLPKAYYNLDVSGQEDEVDGKCRVEKLPWEDMHVRPASNPTVFFIVFVFLFTYIGDLVTLCGVQLAASAFSSLSIIEHAS